MRMDDRLALEIGKAILRALVAEERLAQIAAAEAEKSPDDPSEKPST